MKNQYLEINRKRAQLRSQAKENFSGRQRCDVRRELNRINDLTGVEIEAEYKMNLKQMKE